MKRLAWLLLIAILSFQTVGFSLPASNPASPSTALFSPPDKSIPGYNVACHNVRAMLLCASVSDARVIPGSFVTVYGLMKTRGEPVKGKIMRVTWHSRTSTSCIGITDDTGLASCRTYVPTRMARGYRVNVIVFLDKYKINTSFRTKDMTVDPGLDD